MFGWYKTAYKKLSEEQRQKLSDECHYICHNIHNPNLKRIVFMKMRELLNTYEFLAADADRMLTEVEDIGIEQYVGSNTEALLGIFHQFVMQNRKVAPDENQPIADMENSTVPTQIQAPTITRRYSVEWVDISEEIYFVIRRNTSFVLARLIRENDAKRVFRIYKNGTVVTKSVIMEKCDNNAIAVLKEHIDPARMQVVLDRVLESQFKEWNEQIARLKSKNIVSAQGVVIGYHYYQRINVCAIKSEDENGYHLAIYDKSDNCINNDWYLEKTAKKQIISIIR
jgi:hypothetical protein